MCKRWRYFREEGSATVAWYQILICWHHVSTTLLLNLLKKGSVSLEGTTGGISCLSPFTVSPASQPTGSSSVTRSLYFMMDTASCRGICSSPKSPWVKDSLTRLSPILPPLFQNPWIQTHSSSTPALCQQGRRAATTWRSGRWKHPPLGVSCQGRKARQGPPSQTLAEAPGAESTRHGESQMGLENAEHCGPALADPALKRALHYTVFGRPCQPPWFCDSRTADILSVVILGEIDYQV